MRTFTMRDWLTIAVIAGALGLSVLLKAGASIGGTVVAGDVIDKREAIEMPLHDTWRHAYAWVAEPQALFKLVVGDPPDIEDALMLIRQHGLPRERVLLMPEGLTDETLRRRARELADVCTREGLRLGQRLHIWMWGAKRGV